MFHIGWEHLPGVHIREKVPEGAGFSTHMAGPSNMTTSTLGVMSSCFSGRVFPRSAPRGISAQNFILTHRHPDFRAFGRTRGA